MADDRGVACAVLPLKGVPPGPLGISYPGTHENHKSHRCFLLRRYHRRRALLVALWVPLVFHPVLDLPVILASLSSGCLTGMFGFCDVQMSYLSLPSCTQFVLALKSLLFRWSGLVKPRGGYLRLGACSQFFTTCAF